MPTTYQAGYYLLKVQEKTNKKHPIYSCSTCLNDLAYSCCCLSWVEQSFSEEENNRLQINQATIKSIEAWTDDKFEEGQIHFGNSLPTATLAKEYKNLFFADRKDIVMLHIAFPEQEARRFLQDFAEGNNSQTFNLNNGNFDLYKKLSQKEPVNLQVVDFMGYDLIGVECDGSLHSFHCYHLMDELEMFYHLKTNEYGLFDEILDMEGLAAYLNDPNNEIDSIPFYVAEMYQLNE